MKNLFTAFLSMFIVACSTPEKNANSKIDIYDDSVLDIIDIAKDIAQWQKREYIRLKSFIN